jgi:exonuclease SbcC
LEGAPPHAEVEAAVTEHEAKLQEIQEERGAVAARVAEARRREEQARQLRAAQAAQAATAATWERLRELMGSADGKKLRNFAQGLTLDLLLSVANARLAAMSDRYQLVRDGAGLDIAVIDGYRAGERRSVRNLSGGETFVVSLALALALSSLVSGGGELGCLFVDEGFGTLDEESLELVLESLFALGEENRLVGIISHVPALRERLLCQIAVRPMTPGRSSLWVRTPQGWASLAAGNGG